jgi:hypothetical protein
MRFKIGDKLVYINNPEYSPIRILHIDEEGGDSRYYKALYSSNGNTYWEYVKDMRLFTPLDELM